MSGVLLRLARLVLARKILNAYNSYGFVSAFIYGPQGCGKTTYALWVLREVYGNWDDVIDNTYFYIDSLIPRLKDCVKSGKRIKVVLLDDAGVWLIKYHWRREFSVWFSKLFNLIRTVCSGIIFTSVEASDIVKFVRDKVMFRVQIRVGGVDDSGVVWREARGYEVFVLPTLEHHIRWAFSDYYPLWLPGRVRERYEAKRREALERLVGEVEGRKVSKALPDVGVDVGGLVSEI